MEDEYNLKDELLGSLRFYHARCCFRFSSAASASEVLMILVRWAVCALRGSLTALTTVAQRHVRYLGVRSTAKRISEARNVLIP